jgi:hypothetical protein
MEKDISTPSSQQTTTGLSTYFSTSTAHGLAQICRFILSLFSCQNNPSQVFFPAGFATKTACIAISPLSNMFYMTFPNDPNLFLGSNDI